MKRRAGLLLALLLLGSCHRTAPARQVLHEMWGFAPDETDAGLVVPRIDRLVGRIASLTRLVEHGPVGRKYAAEARAWLGKTFGFDLTDLGAWRRAGFDVTGPFAIFLLPSERLLLRARAADAARAGSTVERIWSRLADHPGRCSSSDGGLSCVSEGVSAAQATGLLRARVEQDLPPRALDAAAVLYVPLDRGGAATAQRLAPVAQGFFAKSKALHVALALPGDEVELHVGYDNPENSNLTQLLRRKPEGKGLLGAAAGAQAVARQLFAPRAVHAQLQALVPSVAQLLSGAFAATTGLDFAKDLIDLLSGEIVTVDFGAEGKAWLVGTRDEERTTRLAERLDGLLGGGLEGLAQLFERIEWTFERTSLAVASRSAYRYRFTVPPAQRDELGTARIDAYLTTAPGALVVALGRKALERVQADLRGDGRAFLDRIASSPARPAFEAGAPLVFWSEVGDALLARGERDRWIAAVGKAHPELPGALYEAATLAELCDEASVSLDVADDSVRLLFSVGVL